MFFYDIAFHLSQLPISHDDVFGDYTCVARNHLGSLRKVVTLAEGAKPGVPHVTVDNIGQVRSTYIQAWSKYLPQPHQSSQESAELVIERNKAEMFLKIVGFRVEVKEKELATWENATIINFPAGWQHFRLFCILVLNILRQMATTTFISESDDGNHFKVSGLLPKTVYNIRVRARNLGREDSMLCYQVQGYNTCLNKFLEYSYFQLTKSCFRPELSPCSR